VVQEFDLPQVKIINNMRPKAGQCGDWRNAMQYQVTSAPGGAVITLEGAYAADCGTRYLELSALNDTQYAFYTFKKLWEMLGGKFTGSLKVNPVPTTAILLETQLSAPLAELIRDINKWSNNLMARQLLLTLAAEKTMTPATAWQGERIVKESLASHGLVFPELVIENGSGLSRIERISTEHLGQLLVHAYRQSTMPEFMASLPILGLDGTVKMRLNHTKAQGQAHLKTGSLNDVTTIAGYVLTANHQRYVVVMFVNGPRAAQARSSQDVLINHIIN
jgi:D-alanyl-D-alanine carboxypeptidase/D-alanyl-D-alanine-endopeptidase (penicillin-binding protein 4)